MNDEQIKALNAIAYQIKYLGNGDANITMGAIENLAVQMGRIADAIQNATEALNYTYEIDNVAGAISEVANSIELVAKELKCNHDY